MRTVPFITGLLLILFGVTAFMINLGFGSWIVLERVWNFWPVLLILAGISMFWGGRIPRLLAVGIALLLAGGVVLFMIKAPAVEPEGQQRLLLNPAEYTDISSAELAVKFGGGKLTLASSGDYVIEGNFQGLRAVTQVEKESGKLKLTLKQPDNFNWGAMGKNAGNVWNLKLAPDLFWNISLEAGAVDGDLDLAGLSLKNLNLKVGAGDIDLTLGNNGPYVKVTVEAGASDVKIRVPENAGVKIDLDSALSSSNLDKLDWQIINKQYVSPGYDESLTRIDLKLNMAVGNFKLERYHLAAATNSL